MALPAGYRWVGPAAKKGSYIVNDEGVRVTRRQVENARFRSAGWSSWSEYQREAKTKQYKRWVKATADNLGLSVNKVKDPSSVFNRLFLKAKDSDFDEIAHGDFAEFLEYTGLRTPGADYDVGGSG